jgi:hypothetical protein
MRRTEAHQGVRMIKFRSVLGRYEASEFNQLEAAELLGVSEWIFSKATPRNSRFEYGRRAPTRQAGPRVKT